MSVMKNRFTANPLFSLGIVLGIIALGLLFVSPSSRLWWFLFCLSGALTGPRTSERESSTNDASNTALTIAFFGVALVFAFFLVPDSFWRSVDIRIPQWVYGHAAQDREAVPVWARVVLAGNWSVVMFRRFQKLETEAAEVAA
jgi:hypothetical protein